MADDHYSKALDHIAAVQEARQSLRELFRSERHEAREVARLNHDLGDALKLAEVHATLAVVEAIDNLVDALDERLAPREVSRLGSPLDPATPGAEALGVVVAGPLVDR